MLPAAFRISLQGKLAALLFGVALAAAALGVVLARRLDAGSAEAVAITALVMLPLALWLSSVATQPVTRLLRALEGAIASYKDGDFSFSLAQTRNDELGDLLKAHNALGAALRTQRQHLVQRELLLDTVVQNTPVALVLADPHGRVAYANLAARQLFNDGRSLGGEDFPGVLERCPAPLRAAVEAREDALFTVELEGAEEYFHLSQRGFSLQGRPHRLYLLRRMTRELSRQEVASWKKVIRVISHELNNSLAPISSLAHSGAELARRGDLQRLPEVFAAVGERAQHLHRFISGYASFAKLPAPRYELLAWPELLHGVQEQCGFRLIEPLPEGSVRLDPAQFEQALINLGKNAVEAGSAPEAVELEVRRHGAEWQLELRDRGSGMNEAVLSNALLPFYSTKRGGSGLGLALVREIVEAHMGRLRLANREGGGLAVTIVLPAGMVS